MSAVAMLFRKEIGREDKVVFLLGDVGSGRTMFARCFTKSKPYWKWSFIPKRKRSMEIDTKKVRSYRRRYKQQSVLLIDTPGYVYGAQDNAVEVAAKISDWVSENRASNITEIPMCIVYFIDITKPRIDDRHNQNIQLLAAKMRAPISNVVATSMWSTQKNKAGEEQRHRQIGTWPSVSSLARFEGTEESAEGVIDIVLNNLTSSQTRVLEAGPEGG